MFTQCSNCNTVFELSPEVLRAAGGEVRCGRCGEIFNALARLAETADAFDTGESAFEMEARADSILESVVAEQTLQASPDIGGDEDDYGNLEIAQLQVLDFTPENYIDESAEDATPQSGAPEDLYPDAALEFTLPPGELDRIFIESSVGLMPPFRLAPGPEAVLDEPVALYDLALPDLPQAEEPAALAALQPLPEQVADSLPEHAFALPADDVEPLFDEGEPPAGIEIVSDDRVPPVHAPLSPLDELSAVGFSDAQAESRGSRPLWLCAAIAAALSLAAQMVHHNRELLTARGPLAPMLRTIYAQLGAPLDVAPNLAAFQLRQWGVTGAAPGDTSLRVRASIMNTTAEPQPFPLLRVMLANRYGTRIGSRDFVPQEYLGHPAPRALSPGEKVDAVLDILDPGQEAEGFELDVCLPGGGRVVCASDQSRS